MSAKPRLRIDGATVVTMDTIRRVLPRASILIEGSEILDIGAEETVTTAPAADVIDATGMIAMPGLIDCHAHLPHTLIKSMGGVDNDAWYRVVDTVYTTGSDPAFWQAAAALDALERLKCGTTMAVSLLGGGNAAMRSDDPGFAEAHVGALAASGLRDILAIGPVLAEGRRPYATWSGGRRTDYDVTFETQLRTCEIAADQWHGANDGRQSIAFLYPTIRPEHVAQFSEDVLKLVGEECRRTYAAACDRGLLFTQDGHTAGTVARHHALGTLGTNCLLSHATDLSAEEIEICAQTGAAIAHNPSAFASITGYCPVPALRDAGVVVGLGSDATAPDRPHDMFRHMSHGLHHHRREARDPGVLAPGEMLEMATIDAARAVGQADRIGSLERGKRADVLLVDWSAPHLVPRNMPIHRLVCFANGADVDTVIVDGEVLMRGREALRVDEARILAEAERAVETMLERTGFAGTLTEGPEVFGRP